MKRPTLLLARPRDGLIGLRGFALARAGAAPGEQILPGLELDLRSKLLGREGFQDIADRSHLGISQGGSCFSFDGIADRVNCGNPAHLQQTGTLTICGWAKCATAQASKALFAKYGDVVGDRGFRLITTGGGALRFQASENGTDTWSGTSTTFIFGGEDIWHHVALVFSPSNYSDLYIDGVRVVNDTVSIPASIYNTTAPVIIGAWGGGGSGNFAGELAHWALYSKLASAEDIEWAYRRRKLPHLRFGSALQKENCKGDWPCDQNFSDALFTFVPDRSFGDFGPNFIDQKETAVRVSGTAAFVDHGDGTVTATADGTDSTIRARFPLSNFEDGEPYEAIVQVTASSLIGTGYIEIDVVDGVVAKRQTGNALVALITSGRKATYDNTFRFIDFRLGGGNTGGSVTWRYDAIRKVIGSGRGSHANNVSAGATPVVFEPDIPQLTENGFNLILRGDGVDDVWTATNPASLNFNYNDAFTVSFLVETEAFGLGVLGKRGTIAPFRGWGIGLNSDQRIVFYLTNTSGTAEIIRLASPVGSISARQVYHVIVTYNGNGVAGGAVCYLNGIAQTGTTQADTLGSNVTTSTSDFTIYRQGNSARHRGILAEISVIQGALTPAQASELYNRGDPIDPHLLSGSPTVLGYWRNGWETPVGTIEDRSMSGINLTINGSPDRLILSARPDNSSRDAMGGFILQRDNMGFADNLPPARVDVLGQNDVAGSEEETWWSSVNPSVTITGSEAKINHSGAFQAMLQRGGPGFYADDILTVGAYYEVVADVIEFTSGNLARYVGTNNLGNMNAVGRFVITGECQTDGRFQFATNAFVGTIDLKTLRVRYIPLPDLFASGGSIYGWAFARGVGGGGQGRLIDKASGSTQGYFLSLYDQLTGLAKLNFQRNTNNTPGLWRTTARDVILGLPFFWGLTYTDGGDPTFYLGQSTSFFVRTVGSGLDEAVTPIGTYDANVDVIARIGNRQVPNTGWHGQIYEVKANRYVMTEDEMRSLWEFGRSEYV